MAKEGVAINQELLNGLSPYRNSNINRFGDYNLDLEREVPPLNFGIKIPAGVNVETIRFYQRKGLLPEPDKPYGSVRRYGEADVAPVKFVKSAQRLGFSLDEVAGLLRLDDGAHCDEARVLAEQKLADVRGKLADLQRIELALERL